MKLPSIEPRSDACLSALRLDQLMAGELGEREAATRAHLDGCADCRARLLTIEEERARFAVEAPPLPVARRTAATSRASRSWVLPSAGAALAAAAAAVLVLRTPPIAEHPWVDAGASSTAAVAPGEGETRAKGAGHIGFFVRRGDTSFLGGPGEVVHPGDALQLVYSTRTAGFLAVLSVDGAGTASVYFPEGARAAPIEPAVDRQLPQSTVLDAALGPETLYALFCDAPIDLAPVRVALQASPASPAVPPGCGLDRVHIDKRAPAAVPGRDAPPRP